MHSERRLWAAVVRLRRRPLLCLPRHSLRLPQWLRSRRHRRGHSTLCRRHPQRRHPHGPHRCSLWRRNRHRLRASDRSPTRRRLRQRWPNRANRQHLLRQRLRHRQPRLPSHPRRRSREGRLGAGRSRSRSRGLGHAGDSRVRRHSRTTSGSGSSTHRMTACRHSAWIRTAPHTTWR